MGDIRVDDVAQRSVFSCAFVRAQRPFNRIVAKELKNKFDEDEDLSDKRWFSTCKCFSGRTTARISFFRSNRLESEIRRGFLRFKKTPNAILLTKQESALVIAEVSGGD